MSDPVRRRAKRTSQCVISGLPTNPSNSVVVASSCDTKRFPLGNYHCSLFDHLDACSYQQENAGGSQVDSLADKLQDAEDEVERLSKSNELQSEQTYFAHELIESMLNKARELYEDKKMRKKDIEAFESLLEESYVEL